MIYSIMHESSWNGILFSNSVHSLSKASLLYHYLQWTPALKLSFHYFLVTFEFAHFVYVLRYKYENDRVMDVSSTEISSPLQYQLYGTGKIGVEMPSRGSQNQLLERQVPSG